MPLALPPLPRTLVIAHHGVADAPEGVDPGLLLAPPARLLSQIRLLTRLRYRVRTAEELLDDDPAAPARRTAVLTFDDGLPDNLEVAAPLLRRLGLRGTFYVNPGLWGAQHEHVPGEAGRLLDADGVRRLHEAGMEIGSHAMTHRDLRTLDEDELRRELVDSKAALEEITGRPCRTLAYPFGFSDERVERAAEAAGYELAFAWRPGPWRRYAVPRLPGPTRHGGGRLALKLLGVRRRA